MYKLLITLLVSVAACSIAYAQKAEVKYYDEHKLLCDKAAARYVATFTHTSDAWAVTEMTTDSTVVMEGYLTAPGNNKEQLRNGHFAFYSDSGLKTHEGYYIGGVKDGPWLYFYDRSNAVEREIDYIKGTMVHCRRYAIEDGKLLQEQYYTSSLLDSSIAYTYYAEGSVKRTVLTISGVDSPIVQCYGLSGADTPCVAFADTMLGLTAGEKMPVAPYDITAYMAEHVHYPESSIKTHIQGKVIVRFVVNEDGSITDVQVEDGLSPELDAEAVKVVSAMPKWTPGMRDGKTVKAFFTLPVTFALP